MARHGITYHDVVKAVNTLKDQHKNITIKNIRHLLGTGSAGTINQHLRRLREAEQFTHPIASKENIPETLITVIQGLWENIISQSAEKLHSLESTYQQTIIDLKNELEKYKNNNQRWQALFQQWQKEHARLINEKLALEKKIADYSAIAAE